MTFGCTLLKKKYDHQFIGTVAFVKNLEDDQIGYRFLEKDWGLGFGSEICTGIISYCKKKGKQKIVGYVVDKNIAPVKILEKK